MKISELVPKQGNVELEEVEVTEKGEIREFSKFGKPGRVCNITVKDDTGSVQMTLWNEQIDEVKEGDKLKITDGWVGEWQGEKQLSTGRNGKFEVLK
ncbi:hypothetical protein CMO92_02930 [Candidatus Woesearchaeota archaeon]|nr:hypothetical protein [Candidatus Woesearchaeota archaeon]|tara:strand:+ start:834 stop:1124 length:291 start_codon:yes stop_codon:yes gene_type:complete